MNTMNPNTTPCPPHLVGKLHESPLPDGVPPLPEGYAHVFGPFADNSLCVNMNIICPLNTKEWDRTGWIGCESISYAVPLHWLASELPKPAVHVEIRLPDVHPKWDEVETFQRGLWNYWLAGMNHHEWRRKTDYENCLDIQEGRLAVGLTKEEAIANYLKRRAGK